MSEAKQLRKQSIDTEVELVDSDSEKPRGDNDTTKTTEPVTPKSNT